MSTDDLPDLPPDALAAIVDAKRLVDPGEAIRARMRSRLAQALPPPPDGGGQGGDEGGGTSGGGKGGGGAFPKAPAWVVAAALAVGGVAGLAYPRAPVERVVYVDVPARAVPTVVAAAPASAPSSTPMLSVDMKDLPSVPTVASAVSTGSAAGPAGNELAAERALLDVARTALGRGAGTNALTACDDHARKFPRGVLAEEREAIAVQALVLEHRSEDARGRAERFRKTYPRSILLPAVLAAAGVDP
jgi:hypothetical protein